jgi:predicted transcriptional regulator
MKIPETSLDAYKSLHPKRLQQMYDKITKALAKLKTGSYEDIATEIGCERNDVSRRLKEMEERFLIQKTGRKLPTKRGREAYEYQLRPELSKEKEQELQDFFSDYQDGRLETPETKTFIQQSFFDN